MERFRQRLTEYNRALSRLQEGLEKPADDDLYVDGICCVVGKLAIKVK